MLIIFIDIYLAIITQSYVKTAGTSSLQVGNKLGTKNLLDSHNDLEIFNVNFQLRQGHLHSSLRRRRL